MTILTLEPIGFIRTAKHVKFDTPHQPKDGTQEENIVELVTGLRLEQGLKDLDGFERIWLIWWFHKNPNWRPLVSPPRGPPTRRGVFATRSPHRPCPIGMTAVPLIKIVKNKVFVGNCDLLEGTPILDIKPYISTVDSFPNQRQGWLEEVEQSLLEPPRYTVTVSELTTVQHDWLVSHWGVTFLKKVTEILERSPERSRAHRITAPKNGEFRLSSGGWRVFFKVRDQQVEVIRIAPGFSQTRLNQDGYDLIPDRDAQRAFSAIWGSE